MEVFEISFGIGSLIAVLMSWNRNKSFILAFIHAWLGWPYVFWWLLTGC